MARLIGIAAIVAVALSCVLAEKTFYSDQYDDIDLDRILKNDRLRDEYYNCIVGNARCLTADAKFYKEIIFEAFATQCERCTERQKVLLEGIADWYTKNNPEQWQILVAKSLENSVKRKSAKVQAEQQQ